jgi:hypothetical protein
MKKKSLLDTNPYLKDPSEREGRIMLNAASSSIIEGVSPSVFGIAVKKRKNHKGNHSSTIAKSIRSVRRKSFP